MTDPDGDSGAFPPRLVYDDDCGFCTWCAEYADARGEFELVGFEELTPDQLARLPDDYDECFHLLTQERVYSCGEALEETMARLQTPSQYTAHLFRQIPGHDDLREVGYRFVADNRATFAKIARREPPARQQ